MRAPRRIRCHRRDWGHGERREWRRRRRLRGVGWHSRDGQCLTDLVKNAPQSGVNGHAYQATLIETQAITRLAKAAGKTYGVAALTVTHGECDAGNSNYESQLFGLLQRYDTDIAAITGQTQPLLMIVSQQNSTNNQLSSTLAQWNIGVDHPTERGSRSALTMPPSRSTKS